MDSRPGRVNGGWLAKAPLYRGFDIMNRPRRLRNDLVQSPLETYLREINETSLLTADQEKSLAREIETGSTEAEAAGAAVTMS